MADPRTYHFRLPRYAGPRLPEPPNAWYPEVRKHSPLCTSERTARADGRVRAFVIHATAGASSAGAMSVMLHDHTASWHWLVPDESEPQHGQFVWACAPESRAAWHVRNDRSHPDVNGGARLVNYWSLGLEIVNTQQDDPFSDWQVEQAAALVRYAWSRYPELVDVVSHAKLDPARRNDPGPAFPWERFRDLVLAPVPAMVAGGALAGLPPDARAMTPAAMAGTAPEPSVLADGLRHPAVRLLGPDDTPIAADARILDGATVGELRPVLEALGFTVDYARDDGHDPVMRIAGGQHHDARPAVLAELPTLAGAPRTIVEEAGDDAGAAAAPRPRAPRLTAGRGKPTRVLDAIPDTLDFRDQMFVPTLVEVPGQRPLTSYRRLGVPILDQKGEGACTGFGLATVANYLLRARRAGKDRVPVSPRMLYEMAKRYDEWPGEGYDGSSARGAVKGWHKHGVCCEEQWPYRFGVTDRELTSTRAADATRRPLGAYFRVNHRDLVAMHAAIAEAGVLFATSSVHSGWQEVGSDGQVPFRDGAIGGHAFAIVAYDDRGFWIQNSWGNGWGNAGFGQVSYDDWLTNGTDVWVVRLGAPVQLGTARASARAISVSSAGSRGYAFEDLRPHVVSLGNDGRLRTGGTYGTSRSDVERIIRDEIPRITAGWKTDRPKRVLLYAHGGLVSEGSALQRLAEYRASMLEAEVFPLSFIWKTDYWTTVTNILKDAVRQKQVEGVLDSSKDFMLDRLDDMLEPVARLASGRAAWQEMQENALLASRRPSGGAALVADLLSGLNETETRQTGHGIELHLVGHSAGSILLAPLVQLLTGSGSDEHGMKMGTVTLWAPACTVELFDQTYRPAIEGGSVGRFALYTLTDRAERDDDCASVYHKSLLYLVSNAFEKRPRLPFSRGTPLLGMERFISHPRDRVKGLRELLATGACEWVRAPNDQPLGKVGASTSRRHGDFDDDEATVRGTLARILGGGSTAPVPDFSMMPTGAGQRDVREALAR